MAKTLKPLRVHIDGRWRVLRPHRLYDNALDIRTSDRYTLLLMDDPQQGIGSYACMSFDESGLGGRGVTVPGRRNGRRIGLQALPKTARAFALARLQLSVETP